MRGAGRAHARGIVHRDLKPGNLFRIERAGQPSIKVLDFGISKFTTSAGTQGQDLTRTHNMFGSPQYMSPEQLRSSKNVDQRTDIWSIGTILFELVTGRAPFTAQTITELAIVIANEPMPDVGALRTDVPPRLAQAIARCLEKDQSRRFQTVADLATALEEFGSKRGRAAVERIHGTVRESEAPPRASLEKTAVESRTPLALRSEDAPKTAAGWGRTGGTSKRPTSTAYLLVAAIVVVLLVAGGALWIAKRSLSEGSSPASVSAAAVPPPAASASAPPPSTPRPLPALSEAPEASPLPQVPDAAGSVSAPPFIRPHPPTPRVAAPAVTSKAPDCDPPYVVNEKGSRVYKKECL